MDPAGITARITPELIEAKNCLYKAYKTIGSAETALFTSTPCILYGTGTTPTALTGQLSLSFAY